jgi:hypothetical protein
MARPENYQPGVSAWLGYFTLTLLSLHVLHPLYLPGTPTIFKFTFKNARADFDHRHAPGNIATTERCWAAISLCIHETRHAGNHKIKMTRVDNNLEHFSNGWRIQKEEQQQPQLPFESGNC